MYSQKFIHRVEETSVYGLWREGLFCQLIKKANKSSFLNLPFVLDPTDYSIIFLTTLLL